MFASLLLGCVFSPPNPVPVVLVPKPVEVAGAPDPKLGAPKADPIITRRADHVGE